jgi:hypothetical protein
VGLGRCDVVHVCMMLCVCFVLFIKYQIKSHCKVNFTSIFGFIILNQSESRRMPKSDVM